MTASDDVGRVADAVKGNWVDRIAPPWLRPWLRLSRADRPAGTWLLLIPCLWGLTLAVAATGFRPSALWIAAGCAVGALLMRGAGCTWNDVTDRHIDGRVARTASRPIPSGQVTVRGALAWMAAQAAAAFLVLLTFPPAAVLLGVVALLPVAVYPFAKRFTWWPQLFLGVAFNWGALLAWTAHTGSLGAPAVLLYLAGIAWTLFYDTIYAYQDIEDDALIGVRSTARRFGGRPGPWLAAFAAAAVLLMAAAVLAALPLPRALVALGGPVALGVHLAWQLRRLDVGDPDRCLALFRSNRDAGLWVLPFSALAAAM
ncbi:4-hydroxybenzoate octaprenyltransferase [Jannaschia sp. W003]|uniref:4-hydroxybenzoate octaprenyltransferase n=1 Tax=Jannaschia sp. W003 TaxID=2867012 RepID=UPI0021A92841|nr:4-hydroxybenzoate octaprenyltransferase [Jannaschia sp. W003]UWQ22721.1 4-hydroxybenzoate octaprenyltransferase [Jannaschia sp. W003]